MDSHYIVALLYQSHRMVIQHTHCQPISEMVNRNLPDEAGRTSSGNSKFTLQETPITARVPSHLHQLGFRRPNKAPFLL